MKKILDNINTFLKHPLFGTIGRFIKFFRRPKSYWSVISLVVIFIISQVVALKNGAKISSFVSKQLESENLTRVESLFWDFVEIYFNNGSWVYIGIGIFLFLVLTYAHVNGSTKDGQKNEILETNISSDSVSSPRIQISKLPETNSKFIGREEDITMLDNAWTKKKTNIFTLKAFGGLGKTALVKTWLNRLAEDNFKGADNIYVHSFYLQGCVEEGQVSADLFFDEALDWFQYEGEKLTSYYNKALKLAELVNKKRTLLVLDGLEPLQAPVNGAMEGALKDAALSVFIKQLSLQNKGLLVILSRQNVIELNDLSEPLVIHHTLLPLSISAGIELFKVNNIKGNDEELGLAVDEYNGHALSLNLLAKYLSKYEDSDVRQRTNLRSITDFPEKTKDTQHAFKVMAAYENQLEGTVELRIMYMMGLFDRPASIKAIQSLRESNLNLLSDTAGSICTSDKIFKAARRRLQGLGLLNKVSNAMNDVIDTHPLVREYFSKRFKQEFPNEWQSAHFLLYEYFKNLPVEEQPEKLNDMEPLFAAVMHGCSANYHPLVFVEVYLQRIRQGANNYLGDKLGAIGTDLSLLAYFFEELWKTPVEDLREIEETLLNYVSNNLYALGRVPEALDPCKLTLNLHDKKKDWVRLSKEALNFSQMLLKLGLIKESINITLNAIQVAKKEPVNGHEAVQDSYEILTLSNLANIQFQSGQMNEAEENFKKAEEIQRKLTPEFEYLYVLQGFNYCELLLNKGDWENVLERSNKTIGWVGILGKIHHISLDQLSMGKAYLQKTVNELATYNPEFSIDRESDVSLYLSNKKLLVDEQSMQSLLSAEQMLNKSVEGLRNAETIIDLPQALIARASYYRWFLTLPSPDQRERLTKAFNDIKEALDLAIRGNMRLYQIDCQLETARLNLTLAVFAETLLEDKKREFIIKAIKHINSAKKVIAETGYERRTPEVIYLEEWADNFA